VRRRKSGTSAAEKKALFRKNWKERLVMVGEELWEGTTTRQGGGTCLEGQALPCETKDLELKGSKHKNGVNKIPPEGKVVAKATSG